MALKNTFLLLTIFAWQVAHAELLIVKRNPQGAIVALDDNDEKTYNVITLLLQRFQWPMCIISSLPEAEKKELYSPGIPAAEEIFIRKKVQRVNPDFDVLFVPTTIYELFCIRYMLSNFTLTQNPSGASLSQPASSDIAMLESLNLLQKTYLYCQEAGLYNTLQGQVVAAAAKGPLEQVLNSYRPVNQMFVQPDFSQAPAVFSKMLPQSPSLAFYINQQIAKIIFTSYVGTAHKSIDTAAEILQKRALAIAAQEITTALQSINKNKWNLGVDGLHLERELQGTALKESGIVKKMIDLEYSLRNQNKAFILRATGGVKQYVRLADNNDPRSVGLLLDNPLFFQKNQARTMLTPAEMFAYYKSDKLLRYSISFGNSLFAGSILDANACACSYIADSDLVYALSIDKYAYLAAPTKAKSAMNRCDKLFFISPLSTLGSFLGGGEFFHSRGTTVATIKDDTVIGLAISNFVDRAQMLIIERDALRHASLFASYMAKNAVILKIDEKLGTSDKVIQEMHRAASALYQAMTFAKALQSSPNVILKKKAREARERVEKKKTAKVPVSAS